MGEQSTPDGSKPAFLSPRQIEAAGAARDGGTQIGLTFAPEGEAQTVDTTARRRLLIGPARLRSDARRTAEYLASRGPTPTEALHDVARMKWKVAIREISRHARCSELEAMKMWRDINVALLPFTAARFDTIELGQQLGASGGLALAHFMAASMVAERMSTGPSTDVQSVDSLNIQPLPLLDMAGPDEGPRAGLPPKPDD
jgi:hypothetical protein